MTKIRSPVDCPRLMLKSVNSPVVSATSVCRNYPYTGETLTESRKTNSSILPDSGCHERGISSFSIS
jgi:hypothetical protein